MLWHKANGARTMYELSSLSNQTNITIGIKVGSPYLVYCILPKHQIWFFHERTLIIQVHLIQVLMPRYKIETRLSTIPWYFWTLNIYQDADPRKYKKQACCQLCAGKTYFQILGGPRREGNVITPEVNDEKMEKKPQVNKVLPFLYRKQTLFCSKSWHYHHF